MGICLVFVWTWDQQNLSIFTFSSSFFLSSSVCLYSCLINAVSLFTIGREMSSPTKLSMSCTNCGRVRQLAAKELLVQESWRFWIFATLGPESERQSTVCHRKPNAALKPTTWQLSTQPSILHFLSREITAEYRLTPCWVKALICLCCSNSSSADPVWHGCHPTARSNPDYRWAGIALTQQGAVWDKDLIEGLLSQTNRMHIQGLTEGQGRVVHWKLPQEAVGTRGAVPSTLQPLT